MKLRLYLGGRQAEFIQGFQNLSIVASQLFGGTPDKDEPDALIPKNKEEMQMAFKNVFGT